MRERIETIPDGTTNGAATGGWAVSTSHTGIKFNSSTSGRSLPIQYYFI